MNDIHADIETVKNSYAVFVEQLNKCQMEAFNRLVRAGAAMRDYSKPVGLIGVARIVLLQEDNT